MSTCSTCPSGASCSHSQSKGGDGHCQDQYAMQEQCITQNMNKIRYKIFVMSGKGGVGKSSVTVNMAAALVARGYKVGILDVDMHGPSVPNLLGLSKLIQADEHSGMLLPVRHSDNLKVISMDALLEDKNQAILWRGPKKASAICQFLAETDWGELDFLLIDSPPGTGDEHMTVVKSIPDAQSVVVTTPQEISLADVRKAINFLQYVNAPILGLVENMSGLTCPHCGGAIELFKTGGGEALARSLNLRFLGAIPLDPATVVAADRGIPVVMLEENSKAKQAFLALADRIAQICAQENNTA